MISPLQVSVHEASSRWLRFDLFRVSLLPKADARIGIETAHLIGQDDPSSCIQYAPEPAVNLERRPVVRSAPAVVVADRRTTPQKEQDHL